MRVRDMTRRQQKAVFANLGNSSSSSERSDRDKILKKEFPQGDFDKDGVKNIKDCEPSNPKKHKKKQDLTGKALKFGVAVTEAGIKAGIKKIKGKTTQEKIKEAKAKYEKAEARIKAVEMKERARKLERVAMKREQDAKLAEEQYKREHPKKKIFGIV